MTETWARDVDAGAPEIMQESREIRHGTIRVRSIRHRIRVQTGPDDESAIEVGRVCLLAPETQAPRLNLFEESEPPNGI